jgi:hypothetical protein
MLIVKDIAQGAYKTCAEHRLAASWNATLCTNVPTPPTVLHGISRSIPISGPCTNGLTA